MVNSSIQVNLKVMRQKKPAKIQKCNPNKFFAKFGANPINISRVTSCKTKWPMHCGLSNMSNVAVSQI